MMKNNGFSGALKLDGFYPSSQPSTPVSADQVSYDNSGSGLPATDVQQAIDVLSMPMQPAQLGLAYGIQDEVSNSDAYGKLSLPGQYSLTVYSAIGSNVPQQAQLTSSLLVQNDTADDSSTLLDKSCITVNSGTIAGCDLTQATMFSTLIQSLGSEFSKSALYGNFLDVRLTRGPSTLVVATNSDASQTVDVDGEQAGYIGNCTRSVTVKDRQFYISEFDDFFIQTLANSTTSKCVFYDETSGRLSYGDAPTGTPVASKTSLVDGKQYGFTSFGSNRVENVGYNNAPNYQVSNAAIINRAVILGQNLFSNASGGGSMQSCFLMGNDITASPTASFINSFIAANNLSNTNFPGTSGCVVIAPRLSGLTSLSAGSNALSNSVIISPDIVTFSAPSGSTQSEDIAITTGQLEVGQKNLILSRTNASVSMTQNTGNGHILLYNADTPFAIGLATQASNNIMLFTGSPTLTPTADKEFLCNTTSARWTLQPNIFFGSVAGDTVPLMFNKATSRVAPIDRSLGGFGLAPTTYNYQVACTLSGGECRGFLTIPTEYQSLAWVNKMSVIATARNPTGVVTTFYSAGVTSIASNTTIKINAYEQTNGGPQASCAVDIIVDVILAF